MRVSAHHMDHFSGFSAVVFAFVKRSGLNVEEMMTASDLAPARTSPLNDWIDGRRCFATKGVLRLQWHAASAKRKNECRQSPRSCH